MAVDTNKKPYFDDYDETKGFHKILYVPGRGVQTRELNQMQTILQMQVSRFGSHVFKEGSQVIPGETNIDLKYPFITLDIDDYDQVKGNLIFDLTAVGSTNGINADVVETIPVTTDDKFTAYVSYQDGGVNRDSQLFEIGERITFKVGEDTVATGTVREVGYGSRFSVNDGVYFIGGKFVYNTAQKIILEKYSSVPSKRIGFLVDEHVVTEEEDESLYDNAQDSSNELAPGAHRLRIDLDLVCYDIGSQEIPTDFVEIAQILDGEIQSQVRGSDYNELADILAKRTYDQSGDYTVNPFNIQIREHLQTEDNNGYKLAEDGGDETKFVVGIEPGLAYVRGYEVENLATVYITTDKARETEVVNNSSISAQVGFYVTVKNLNTLPSFADNQKIQFFSGTPSIPGAKPAGNIMGTAYVRLVDYDGANYRLYIFGPKNNQGVTDTTFITGSKSVYSSAGSVTFSGVIVESKIQNSMSYSMIFPLQSIFVKSLLSNDGSSDSSYTQVREYNTIVDSSGMVSLSAGSNEIFVAQDSSKALAAFTDNTGGVTRITKYSLGGTPSGKSLTVDLGSSNAGRPVRLSIIIVREVAIQKTKTIRNINTTTNVTNSIVKLGKADAQRVRSVVDSKGVDITYAFDLFRNDNPAYYDISYIKLNDNNVTINNPVTVNFDYFVHGAGDFFSVDSYSGIEYEDIPFFESASLADVLDFRPRIADNGTDFISTGSSAGRMPSPYSIVRADVEYYLPRIDKVCVNSEGEFMIVNGVPAMTPKEPDVPTNTMALYTLNVPPYTENVANINAIKVNNRRYTMKDIGKLDRRISNLEYYVTLSLLEKDTADMQIVDPQTGLNRYKNGFMVDPFVDHGVGDFTWPGYHVAMMPTEGGGMRPEVSYSGVDMEYSSAQSSNVVVNDGLMTLPYSNKEYITQMMGSNLLNVNPYAVYRWNGELDISPKSDSWVDTNYVAPDVTYQLFNNGNISQTWKANELYWTGGSVTNVSQDVSNSSTSNSVRSKKEKRAGHSGKHYFLDTTTTNTTTTATTITATNTNVNVINDRTLDTSVVPYMRSREIRIEGVGFKPSTKTYFFFDNVNVDQFVRPADDNTYGRAVYSDKDGKISAVFKLPNTAQNRFRTGQRALTAIDNLENIKDISLSYGETTYSAYGIKEMRQKSIVAVRNVESATTVQRDVSQSTSTKYLDPLAQSFLVEETGGVCLTSIDIFFGTKDNKVPVSVDIRAMENGSPTQNIVPGSTVVKTPNQVNVSFDGSVATNFKFRAPVYLEDGREYCFVITSNSNNYYVIIATMGNQDFLSKQYISKQPYIGVMFKSQNSSTWTEDQQSDIKFRLNRAIFNTGVTGSATFVNKSTPNRQLQINPVRTTSGSDIAELTVTKHGYIPGSLLTISGAVGSNGITDKQLNGTYTVIDIIDPNTVTIKLPVAATAGGRIGSEKAMVTENYQLTGATPNISEMVLPNTYTAYSLTGVSGQSISGNEPAYRALPYSYNVTPNETVEFNEPWIVSSDVDQKQNYNNKKMMTMQAILRTDNPNISPVIDVERMTVVGVLNEIDSRPNTGFDGSNIRAMYRTNVAGLANAANNLKVFVDIACPQSADVVVSYRTGNNAEEIDSATWKKLPDINVGKSGSMQSYVECEYGIDDISDYTYYQIAIGLKSTSAAQVPICQNLRTIALGT